MKADLKKQDKILETIGLKRIMIWEASGNSNPVYAKSQFKDYVTSEYEESQRKKTDEVYRMSEFNLLHIDSGLRVTLTERESYDGETEEYKVIRMFVTAFGKESEVIDADFGNEIFYTSDLDIPFAETYKLIEFEDDEEEPEGELEKLQKLILDLHLGRRKPENDEERKILKEIRDAEAKGYTIDLPLF